MSHFDIPTLFLAIVVVTLLLGVAIGLLAGGSAMQPLRWWAGAMLLYSGAYVLLMLRGQIPDVISIVIANMIHSGGLAVSAVAIDRLARANLPRWLYWTPPLLIMVVVGAFMADFKVRSIFINGLFLVQALVMIHLLRGYRAGRSAGRLLLIGTLTVMVVVFFLRMVAFILGMGPPQTLMAPGPLQTATYVLALSSLLLCSLGFLFMVKEQADRAAIDNERQHQAELTQRLAEVTALNRRLEEAQNQLLQSEKLASIGQLAAGVAHEINNPIGFVNSNLGTLTNYVADLMSLAEVGAATPAGQALAARIDLDYLRGDLRALLAESTEGLERVRKIVQDLKDFSRVGDTDWQRVDVHRCLDSTLNVIWNELKYKCTVSKDYAPLPQVYCLPSQLNQVFMNLLLNAAQAIEEQGEIVIRTKRAGDNEVAVSIADTGSGIAPENRHRVFEPFFTTKPVGKGTGLGLSLAWSIVQRHRGRIEVASEPGLGTTFTVILPIEPPAGAAEKSP